MAKSKKKENLTIEEKLEQALVPREEWPYEVPENWCWVRLKAVCYFENGYAFKSDYFTNNGIPVIRISNIQDNSIDINGCVCTSQTDIEDRFIVNNGDLLIAMSGATTGKNGVFYSEKKAYLNQRVGNIKIKNEDVLIPKFRNYYIMSSQQKILDSAYGGAQPNISSEKIGNMIFPLSPLAEQQRIVDRIESLFSKLDEAKERTQEALDSFEERKAAILHKAFSGELTKKWREKKGVSFDSWEMLEIGEVVKPVKDKFIPNVDRREDYKYIGLEHIEKGRGIISFGCSDDVKSTKTIFRKTDILYGKLRPYLNKHDVASYEGICSTDILVYRAESLCTAKYINYIFDTINFIEYAIDNSSGINLPRTSEKAVSAYKVAIPEIKEQEQIVKILDMFYEQEFLAQEKITELLDSIENIKKSILAKAFRGELGTNDLEEESATKLLKTAI